MEEMALKRKSRNKRTCSSCDHPLTNENAPPSIVEYGSGNCTACERNYRKTKYKQPDRVYQELGRHHVFPCGCSGTLPLTRTSPNMFALMGGISFVCRVSHIIQSSQDTAKRNGYVPIPKSTPHQVIRDLMEKPDCVCCGTPLNWVFGQRTTPHLHHHHETGEIFGFSHPRCNSRALELEIERLRAEIKKLKGSQ